MEAPPRIEMLLVACEMCFVVKNKLEAFIGLEPEWLGKESMNALASSGAVNRSTC